MRGLKRGIDAWSSVSAAQCEGPGEDGDWQCPVTSRWPGPCPNCLHNWGIEREIRYTCVHGC
jgi:hypothetical protein